MPILAILLFHVTELVEGQASAHAPVAQRLSDCERRAQSSSWLYPKLLSTLGPIDSPLGCKQL
jgi:hypothetical protein